MKKKAKKEEFQVEFEEGKAGRAKNGAMNTVVNIILVLTIILAAVSTYVSYVSTSGNGVPSIMGVRVFSIQTDSIT